MSYLAKISQVLAKKIQRKKHTPRLNLTIHRQKDCAKLMKNDFLLFAELFLQLVRFVFSFYIQKNFSLEVKIKMLTNKVF